jgi:hypothetical protein
MHGEECEAMGGGVVEAVGCLRLANLIREPPATRNNDDGSFALRNDLEDGSETAALEQAAAELQDQERRRHQALRVR